MEAITTQQQNIDTQNVIDAGDGVICLLIFAALAIGFMREGWHRQRARRAVSLRREIERKVRAA